MVISWTAQAFMIRQTPTRTARLTQPTPTWTMTARPTRPIPTPWVTAGWTCFNVKTPTETEFRCTTDRAGKASQAPDTDGDGFIDAIDEDIDNDGYSNAEEIAAGAQPPISTVILPRSRWAMLIRTAISTR